MQRLGGRLDVQLLEDAGSLGARDLAQDVRDVGRMEPLELLLGQRGLEALEAPVERLHRVPRDEPRGKRRVREPSAARRDARAEDPPHEAAHADVGSREHEVARQDVELEVVHAHDLHAVDVDDLLVEEVAREEDLVLPRGTVQEVLPHEAGADGAALEDGDVLPGQDERLEAVADEEARDARKGSARARGDGEVADLSDGVSRHVAHRLAEKLGDEEPLVRGDRGRARGRRRRRCRHGGIVRRRRSLVNACSGNLRRMAPRFLLAGDRPD